MARARYSDSVAIGAGPSAGGVRRLTPAGPVRSRCATLRYGVGELSHGGCFRAKAEAPAGVATLDAALGGIRRVPADPLVRRCACCAAALGSRASKRDGREPFTRPSPCLDGAWDRFAAAY